LGQNKEGIKEVSMHPCSNGYLGIFFGSFKSNLMWLANQKEIGNKSVPKAILDLGKEQKTEVITYE